MALERHCRSGRDDHAQTGSEEGERFQRFSAAVTCCRHVDRQGRTLRWTDDGLEYEKDLQTLLKDEVREFGTARTGHRSNVRYAVQGELVRINKRSPDVATTIGTWEPMTKGI